MTHRALDDRVLAAAWVGGAVLAGWLAIGACSSREPWTPYREPEPAIRTMDGVEFRLTDLPKSYVKANNAGCVGCHATQQDPHAPTFEMTCVDCHGGNGLATTKEEGHVAKPDHPELFKSAANPERLYTRWLDENKEWVRFVNPGDLRVASEACGSCHGETVLAVQKSLMTTSAHFWGVAGYANGIVPNKRTIFGESYSPEGYPQKVNNLVPGEDGRLRPPTGEEIEKHGYAPFLVPLPHWEVTQPGNVYRVFEKGSRLGTSALGFNGLNSPVIGIPDKLEDPGRPNNRLSDRGLGTLNRVDLPLLNVHKTRLNDPHLSFLGTNDQPGDFRSSGCTACHMVYANDRDPVHSGPYARHGNWGQGNAPRRLGDGSMGNDPTIPTGEPGHPIEHRFTRAIPSSQCMVCHMHQPNSFVNSFYGYQMWTYETDGERMWPGTEETPSHSDWFLRVDRNPEGAAVRGNWGDRNFLGKVAELNPTLRHTQFADYHGHGWIFRAVFKTDRRGNLVDKDGKIVPYDDPKKFEGVIPTLGDPVPDPRTFEAKAGHPVHLKDIHAEKGMHCVDCHFTQDVHGDGTTYAEYQAAVEITCQDCHGTTEARAALFTSGPAKKRDGRRLDDPLIRAAGGRPRFEVGEDGAVWQQSMLYKDLRWKVKQVKDSVDPQSPSYNRKAAYAKLQPSTRKDCPAHGLDNMECYTCHTAWVTSCFGCHLPQKANFRTSMHHFESEETRNYATYNPQVARDDAFLLGIAGDVKKNKVSTVRSSSAVLISSEDAQRRRIYKQLPTIAANGMSSQAFNSHFAHTVRTTETRQCDDCHVSEANDNNAWLAQTYLLGTNTVNFMGFQAFVGLGDGGLEAIQITEWEEPQAVIGSNLHRLAYPESYRAHVDGFRQLQNAVHHSGTDVRSVELRGEYLYAACGPDGFRVYDVANVANKDFSEKIVTSPVSPLGQDTHVRTRYATAVALPTNNNISMSREYRPENRETPYAYRGRIQNMHESYRYAYVTDRYEGLVIVDVDSLTDGDPQNNFLERVVTFNPEGFLDGAENLAVAGTTVYVCCRRGVVAVSIADPRAPRIVSVVGAPDVVAPTSVALQFRYAFVTDSTGVKVIDVTFPEKMAAVRGAVVPIAGARDIYVARHYGYVSAGADGLVIVDVETPTRPRLDQKFDGGGAIWDLRQTKVAMAYDSLYGFLADGRNGFHVIQLVTPEDGGRSAYGFSPRPRPALIASHSTDGPALAVAKGLDRDRAVDESGNQMAVFGRIGGRPFNLEEMRRLFIRDGGLYTVTNLPDAPWSPPGATSVGGGQ